MLLECPICCLIQALDLVVHLADKQWFKQPGYHLAYPEADPPYPFQRIKFTDGRDTGVTMVAAPFFDTNYYRSALVCVP